MNYRLRNIDVELNIIKATIARFPEGATLDMIKETSELELTSRTLQRRLDKLKESGAIIVSGKTRTVRYHIANMSIEQSNIQLPAEAAFIHLSYESQMIQAAITKPVAERIPVGYNLTFLQSYKPNIDSYLTTEEKYSLAALGKTAQIHQPAGTYAKEILQRLLIDLSWNSSRLEGNTYSLLDTQQLIAKGKTADGKTAAEAQMILNHKDAIEFIVQAADEIDFNRYTITNLHALLSNNLLADPAASGRLRTFGVGIAHSAFTPLAIPQQIEEMFELMLEKAGEINDPFEQAFFIMVQLPYLQLFDDVNKRVSRLAANISLNKENLAPLAFVDVPDALYIQGMLGVYELNKVELLKDLFIWAYERSALRYAAVRQALGKPDEFRLKYRDEIKRVISEIVTNAIPPQEAIKLINDSATALPPGDRNRFIETVDTELLSLHEGNFARYQVRPSRFTQWQKAWNQ